MSGWSGGAGRGGRGRGRGRGGRGGRGRGRGGGGGGGGGGDRAARRALNRDQAAETLAVLEGDGTYPARGGGGRRVDLRAALDAAREGTVVHFDREDTSLRFVPAARTLEASRTDAAVIGRAAAADADDAGALAYAVHILAAQMALVEGKVVPRPTKDTVVDSKAEEDTSASAAAAAAGGEPAATESSGAAAAGGAAGAASPSPSALLVLAPMQIRVKLQTTLEGIFALHRAGFRTCALNFASAKNPGGGFLKGSQAQEESLARSSGLYWCIGPQSKATKMYATNRADPRDCLYHEILAVSPSVPVFRDDEGRWMEQEDVAYCDMLTCPAVNAGHAVARHSAAIVRDTMRSRIGRVVSEMEALNVDAVVLGAYGCGVFGNEIADVAHAFALALAGRSFRKVRFCVLDPNDARVLRTTLGVAE